MISGLQLEGCIGFQLAAVTEGGEELGRHSRQLKVLRKPSGVIHIRKGVRVMGRVEEFQSVLRKGVSGFG